MLRWFEFPPGVGIFFDEILIFVGPLIPLFWTSGDVCSGFQSRGVACMFHHLCMMDFSDSPLSTTAADLLAANIGLKHRAKVKVTPVSDGFIKKGRGNDQRNVRFRSVQISGGPRIS